MIETLILLGHIVVAGLIIALVLLQRGKGAEAGTGFGAGASGTVFGARGSSNFFSRATAVLATLFFATSLTLAYFATRDTGSSNLLEGSLVEGAGNQETETGESLRPAPESELESPGAEEIDNPPTVDDIDESPNAGDEGDGGIPVVAPEDEASDTGDGAN